MSSRRFASGFARLAAPALVLYLVFALALPIVAAAQTAGSLSGTVRDPSGAALPGAALRVTGPALQGRTLTAHSDAAGRYLLSPLPPGDYTVETTLDGFAASVHREVRVGVHEDVVLDVALALSAIEETVEVVGGGAALEVSRSDLGERIAPEAIEALPLNGRNFEDLVALVPGVKPNPEALRDRAFSIFGERPAATSFLIDGADNNDPIDGGALQRFSQDAIQEFEVATTGYEAELGRAQGGVINVVTRSGTNTLRGSAFLFARDDSLDSSNVSGQDAPALERTQWGASVGGPLVRDRAFYFLSAETLDEKRGRNLDLSTVPAWVLAGLATPSGAEDLGAGPSRDGFSGLGKIDFLPGSKQRFSLDLTRNDDDAQGEVPPGIAGSLVLPSATRAQDAASTSAALRHTRLFQTSAVLESSARWTSGRTLDNLDGDRRPEAVLLLLRNNFIQTGAPLGGNRRDLDRLHLAQSYSLLRGSGAHELKMGWEFLRTDLEGSNALTNDVEYSAAFFSPDAPEVMEDLFGRLGFAQSAARFFFLSGNPDGSLDLDLENDDLGVYAQDRLRLGAVTVDLGLRWDRASLFGEDTDNFAPRLGVAWDVGGRHRTVIKANAGIFYDRNALIAASTVPEKGGVFTRNAFDVALPRLGFEYTDSLIDVVITSGFPGVFPPENPAYAALADDLRENPFALYELLGIAVSDPGAPPVVTADNLAQLSGMSAADAVALLESVYPGTDWEFFDVPGGSIVGDRVLSFFPRGPLDRTRDISVFTEDKTPYTFAFTVGVEQQLTRHWRLSASYVHRRTRDLLTRRILNLFDVAPGDPNFARTLDGGPRINAVTYDGRIDYDGFVVSVARVGGGDWSLRASYTYSDAEDNLLTGEVGSGFSNNNHPEFDLGPSNLAVPHIGVVSGNARLPKGWWAAGNVFLRSGNAFSPRGLVDSDGDGLVDQRDLAFPRNSFRADAFFQVDLRLEKEFRLGGGRELRFLIDVFNATNEDNVAGVNSVSGPDFGVPNNFFPGRELQLGIRYFFGR